ncbi:hypothetical protein K402DRAFT_10447 [Aulographum hederae CBS 113979]|uniref:Uncharacterized protein n=1 Tax=Aulographum hederae CBS 113979 TaxID=1176131 RepID=A0A6G1HHW8_9PEZI|nr:hypothetical protein K402DRAFT_10447 [Aulographum hederae CBS 113979]
MCDDHTNSSIHLPFPDHGPPFEPRPTFRLRLSAISCSSLHIPRLESPPSETQKKKMRVVCSVGTKLVQACWAGEVARLPRRPASPWARRNRPTLHSVYPSSQLPGSGLHLGDLVVSTAQGRGSESVSAAKSVRASLERRAGGKGWGYVPGGRTSCPSTMEKAVVGLGRVVSPGAWVLLWRVHRYAIPAPCQVINPGVSVLSRRKIKIDEDFEARKRQESVGPIRDWQCLYSAS